MLRILLFAVIIGTAWSCQREKHMIVGWGDSMMKGSGSDISILEVIEDELGMSQRNFGEGGLWSSQVALLQGAHGLSLEAEANDIKPWGEIKLKIKGAQPFNSFGPQEYDGTLSDISGTLVRVHTEGDRTQTSHFEFKRSISFFDKAIDKPLTFTFENAIDYNESMTIIWAGRNDDKSGDKNTSIVDNLEEMVKHLSLEAQKRTLVLSICNARSSNEGKGTIPYERIITLNKIMQERLPEYYIDVRTYMVQKAIYDMGITPKPEDLAAIENDAIPDVFFKDHVHFNELGNIALGKYLSQVIRERDWIK